jgi:hypothetical protein
LWRKPARIVPPLCIALFVERANVDAIAKVIDAENLEPLIRQAFDRLLTAGEGDIEEHRDSLARQRTSEEARLERMLVAIADGTVTPDEARQQLAAIRKRIDDAGMALERLKFDERRLGAAGTRTRPPDGSSARFQVSGEADGRRGAAGVAVAVVGFGCGGQGGDDADARDSANSG